MTQNALLDRLEAELRDLLEQVRSKIAKLPEEALKVRKTPENWNILECFAHLNAYTDHYMSHIERSIHKAKARRWSTAPTFHSTWFGRYSVAYVDPANLGAKKKRKSPKRFNYWQKDLHANEVRRFIISTEMLLRNIGLAREIDLNKPEIPLAQFKLLKMNLGDMFEFLVTHNRRHVLQALSIVEIPR